MPLLIVLTDLQTTPFRLERYDVKYQHNTTAMEIISQTLGEHKALEIELALKNNAPHLIVSWYNVKTEEISEIGGVGTLNWLIEDHSLLSINYDSVISLEQENEYEQWILDNITAFILNTD